MLVAKSNRRPGASAHKPASAAHASAIAQIIAILLALIGELRRMNRLGLDRIAAQSTRRERAVAVIAELDRRHRHPNRCC
jgi:hypothetical protein